MIKLMQKVMLRILNTKVMYKLHDEIYLKIAYLIRTGSLLNLNKPLKFSEKLQWLKLHDRKPVYTKMADKLKVREILSEKFGKDIIIPVIGIWDSVDDINFSELPNRFVLKCNHDSGSSVVCNEKALFLANEQKLKRLKKCLNRNYYYCGREWPYKNISPKIFAEPLLSSEKENCLYEYKVMCFNGEPKIIIVYYLDNNNQRTMTYYDLEWNRMNCTQKKHQQGAPVPKPKKLNQMLEVSKTLAKEIPFLRVDFIANENELYFGEVTFYPSSGFIRFIPERYDFLFGEWLNLPVDNNKNADNYLRKVQLIQLEMLKEVKRICDKYHINYFLDSGTLLGAVRHKGFIPWDDDLDIGMIREDYEKFIKVAEHELDKNYYLQNWYTDKNYGQCFTKIRKNNTKYVEIFTKNINMHSGIYIDIFAYDYYSGKKITQGLPLKIIRRMILAKCGYQMWRTTHNTINKKKWFIYQILKLMSIFFKKELLAMKYDKIAQKYNDAQLELIFENGGANTYDEWVINKRCFESYIELPFEDDYFKCPIGYDEYLRTVYGNYMELPPINNRINRHKIIDVQL